jgi:hypothetical protein
VLRKFDGEQFGYVTGAITGRRRSKYDGRSFAQLLRTILEVCQQQLKVVPPVTVRLTLGVHRRLLNNLILYLHSVLFL